MTLSAMDLAVRIGSATLLDDVSLDLKSGDIVAVTGPNGAGKTTLVRALAGDIQPGAGSVRLDERVLADWPGADLARRRAVMAADGAVSFGFSVREVALLGRLPHHGGHPDDADRATVDRLLEAVDCTHLADRVFATLSTGERQRVQLARAIAQITSASQANEGSASTETHYLLLDEPTSSLDPAHQHSAMRLLRHQAEANCGILAVLHDLNLAAAYADRIALMKDGHIVEIGTPVEVLRADLLESIFEVPMAVVPHPRLPHLLVVAEPRSG